jgi:hypothetical protein
MPLTISHPAASVPFARLGLVLSALVIGSMTPDYPYYISIFPYSGFSHSVIGLFAYCLPVGLVSLGVFHFLIKYPALSLLPVDHQRRLYAVASGFSFWPLRRFLLIVFSIISGAFTHLIWDAFTHPKGWMVQQFTLLKLPILTIGSFSLPIYSFLQYSSTFIGGVLLFYWYIEWYDRAKLVTLPTNLIIPTHTKSTIFSILVLTSLAAAIFSGLVSIPEFRTSLHFRLFIGHMFIVGVTVFILELMFFSAYWHLKIKMNA